MIQVETYGIKIELSDDVLDDWDVLEMLREYDKGNHVVVVDLMQMMLGKEQYKALKAAIKINEGRVSSKAMFKVFNKIMSEVDAVKK